MDHPLRPIRKMVDEILREMSPEFLKLYSPVGRPSIAPERLLRSLLLQIFYSVRSERMLIEQLKYNLLFRWFVGMENLFERRDKLDCTKKHVPRYGAARAHNRPGPSRAARIRPTKETQHSFHHDR
jgi:transposase